jgi:hypothetical protein
MPKVSLSKGRVTMSKGKISNKNTPMSIVTEEMIGKGKKEVSGLMLKLETPKKYISFR